MRLNRCCVAALLTLISMDLVYGGALKKMFVKDGASEHIQPGDDKNTEKKAEESSEAAASETAEPATDSSVTEETASSESVSKEEEKKIEGDPVVFTIGKDTFKRSAVLKEVEKLPPQVVKNATSNQLFMMARDNLVSSMLMLRAAKKTGLNKEKAYLERLEDIKDKLLVESYVMKNLGAQAPTEATLKARHTKYLIEFKKQKETHVFNIVVDTEAKAKEVVAKLSKGADFKKLINEYSLYKDHAEDGAWLILGMLPPPLKTPLTKLKKGEYTKEPVKMGSLFAIFKVGETRDTEPLKYEDAKGMLSQLIMQEKFRDLIVKLVKQYDVKVFKEDGSPDKLGMVK